MYHILLLSPKHELSWWFMPSYCHILSSMPYNHHVNNINIITVVHFSISQLDIHHHIVVMIHTIIYSYPHIIILSSARLISSYHILVLISQWCNHDIVTTRISISGYHLQIMIFLSYHLIIKLTNIIHGIRSAYHLIIMQSPYHHKDKITSHYHIVSSPRI